MISFDEKMAAVRELLSSASAVPAFTNPLKADTLKNRDICGVITGYSFQIDNLSYRGIWISTIEKISVIVDGEEVPQDHMVLSVKGMKIPLKNLGGHTEVFVGAEDELRVVVYRLGGLSEGKHHITLKITRRNDFGHTVGNGTEGYEEATEFTVPKESVSEQDYVI